MDAVSALKPHIDITRIMTHYGFERMREEGNTIRSCCKLHGGNNSTSFVANMENGLWYCHTSCGGGDAFTMVQHMENCDFIHAVRKVADILGISISDLQIIERKAEFLNELQRWISVMKSRKEKPAIQEYVVDVELRHLSRFRNFHIDTIEKFGLRYVDSLTVQSRNGREYELRQRLFVPITQEGRVIGASLRRTKSNHQPKWSHQPAHIKTNEMLYNMDRTKGSSIITLVEGIFDVWAYDEIEVPAVCTFGAHLSDEQYRILIKSGADVALSYDGDDAGNVATAKAIKQLKQKCNLYVVDLGVGNDPESISRDELRRVYNEKRRV